MEHITQLSERIVQLIPGATTPVVDTSENIKYFVIDIVKIMKNINETSFNETDRLVRINDLSRECGIDLTKYI